MTFNDNNSYSFITINKHPPPPPIKFSIIVQTNDYNNVGSYYLEISASSNDFPSNINKTYITINIKADCCKGFITVHP